MSGRSLRSDEKRLLALLGLPTAALALAITVVTTYLPVVAREYLGSTTVIGLLIGLEGVMALWVPLLVGAWSDGLRTPLGRRLPFLLAAAPLLVIGLVIIGFASNGVVVGVAAALFFCAYFIAYEPYRALYPDLVEDEVAGRAQSTQAVWRGVGTGLALVGGGLLVAVGAPWPFVVAALVMATTMVSFVVVAQRRRRSSEDDDDDGSGERTSARELIGLVREHAELRTYLAANALWEASLSALKTFVFLFVSVGAGLTRVESAGVIGAGALVALVGAAVSGALGDRVGRLRLMTRVLPFYGVGLLVPALTQSPLAMVPTMLLVGLAGGVVMTLPYAILQPLMPERHHGALTGFYTVSRGLGSALGPLLAGVAIELLADPFSGTEGYAAMWLICGAAVLLSVWPARRLRGMVDQG